jgi:3-hydroxybutyryl-CoA dehydrogenase
MTEVTIVGAGLMGHALALVYVLGGHRVRLTDSNPTTLMMARQRMESALGCLLDGGEVDDTWTVARLDASLRLCPTLKEAVDDTEVVVEAITEDPPAKERLYAELAELMHPAAILASNTSHLDVFPLIPASLQRRSVITHWYSPPYLIDLVDIAAGPDTDPAVVERVRASISAMGKRPLVFRNFIPGYVANRIQTAISREVYSLLDDGLVTPHEVDHSIVHGLALRFLVLGHLAKADFAGLPLSQHSLANREDDLSRAMRANSETLDQLIADGHTGVLSGRGFFDWSDHSPDDLFRERDRRLIGLKQTMRNLGGPLRGK